MLISDTPGVAFHVLFVCTGNVCRSPAAELLFARAARARTDLAGSSAGMDALDGHGIDHATAEALLRLGVDPSRHVARTVTTEMLASADLILTAEGAQRDRIMAQFPTLFRRTFTLLEFARLGGSVDAAGPAAAVAQIAGRRGAASPRSGEHADDVRDPYRDAGPLATQVVAQILACTEQLVLDLRPAARRREPRPGSSRRPSPVRAHSPTPHDATSTTRRPRPRPRPR